MRFSWLWIIWASLLAVGGLTFSASPSDRLTSARDLAVTVFLTTAVVCSATQSYRVAAQMHASRAQRLFPESVVIPVQLSAELATVLGCTTPPWGTCCAVVSVEKVRVLVGARELREVACVPARMVREVRIGTSRILGEKSVAIEFVVPWAVLRFVPLATGVAIGPFASRSAAERVRVDCLRILARREGDGDVR
jgi:hypothetical protein